MDVVLSRGTKMLRNLCMMIGFVALGIGPALPDVIDVTVNGTASGSGDLQYVCGLATPGCVQDDGLPPLFTVPYSFSGTNTQLGSFGAFGNAQSPPGRLKASRVRIQLPPPTLCRLLSPADISLPLVSTELAKATKFHSASTLHRNL